MSNIYKFKDEKLTRSSLRLEIGHANSILKIAHRQTTTSTSLIQVASKHQNMILNLLVCSRLFLRL